MATVKKSKKKIVIPIVIILVIAIVATSIVIYKKNNSGEQVSLNTIGTGDIYENVSATGEITAGASREYKVDSVATVKEVFVSVGDKVKKGDKLASFDTAKLDTQVASLQAAYTSANTSYNNSVKSQKAAKKNLAAVNKKIAKLNKDIAKLSAPTTTKATTTKATTKAATTTATTVATTTAVAKYTITAKVRDGMTAMGTVAVGNNAAGATSEGTYNAGTSVTLVAKPTAGYSFDGWYDQTGNKVKNSSESRFVVSAATTYYAAFKTSGSGVSDISSALTEISNTIKDLTDDVNTMVALLNKVSTIISQQLANGVTSSTDISKAVENGIKAAINDGTIDEAQLNVIADTAAKTIAKTVQQIDWATIAKNFTGQPSVALTTKQIQLAALTAEKELYTVEASDTTVNANKNVMKTAKSALDAVKESQTELQAGWTASFDGTITECDLSAGEQTSLLTTGIKLEDTSSMVVTISLGEYDNHKVKVGMPCTVTTAYGTYDGEILSKAPTATGGSSSSIVDSVGSMAGISGLSSLTDSGAGVECQVKVDDPDENIIIGFDADVEISTGQYIGVTVVPIESIKLEKTGSYVYLYNEKDSTVTKTQIKTGAVSDSYYEVTDGIKPGDKIVAAPASTYETDTFEVKIVDAKETTTAAE